MGIIKSKMRSTKLFKVSMDSVMGAAGRLAFVGLAGLYLGEPGTALMPGGAWAGLKGSGILGPGEVVPEKRESGAERIRRVASSCNTPEELEEAVIEEWKLSRLAWKELVTLREETPPAWAKLLKGQWVAEGIADKWSPFGPFGEFELEEVNWVVVDWLDQKQLDEMLGWLIGRGWNTMLEGILKNMSHEAWSRLSRGTLKGLMMSNQKEIRLAAMAGARKSGIKTVASGSQVIV